MRAFLERLGASGLLMMVVMVLFLVASFEAHGPRGCAGWGDVVLTVFELVLLGGLGGLSCFLVSLIPTRKRLVAPLAGILAVGAVLGGHGQRCSHPRCGWDVVRAASGPGWLR